VIPAGTQVYSYVTAGSSVLLEKDQEQVEALCFVCIKFGSGRFTMVLLRVCLKPELMLIVRDGCDWQSACYSYEMIEVETVC